MSKKDKAIAHLKSRPKDLTWRGLVQMLKNSGYHLQQSSGGSHRAFEHEEASPVYLHEPHAPKIVKGYAVRLVLNHLKSEGLIE